MREIVGAKIHGSTITNSLHKIVQAAKEGRLDEVYDRKQMQFMSGCDLGRNWDLMASGPTLFLIDEDGKPKWPTPNVEFSGQAADLSPRSSAGTQSYTLPGEL